MKIAYAWVALWLSALLVCGCQVSNSHTPAMLEPHITRLAVMPFSGPCDPEVCEMVRHAVYNNLAVLGFADVKLGEVDYRLDKAGISKDGIETGNAAEIASALGADALLFGKITKATNLTAIAYSETRIAGSFYIVDAKSGLTIWQATHADGQRGGVFLDMLCVVETIEDQMANMVKRDAYQRAADKLARKVVATIPDAAGERIAQAPLPEILSIQAERAGAGAENQIVAIMKGSPGMTATMNIPGVQDYIPMTEAPPGVYTGAYAAHETEAGSVVCRIQDRSGAVVQRTVPVGRTLASR